MRGAKYNYYVVKMLKLPYDNCREYVCVPNAWIAGGNRKKIFVRYPSKKIPLMKTVVRRRRRFGKDWKFYRAQLIFGADTYKDVKKCIEEKKFEICQDFWILKKQNKERIPSSSNTDAAPKPNVDKPQMKVAPTIYHQNAAIKRPIRRLSWPDMRIHRREIDVKDRTSLSADKAMNSSEPIKNINLNRLTSAHETNHQPNRTIVRMSTMINDIIDKNCLQNVNFNDINSQIQSYSTLEGPTNQLNTLNRTLDSSCFEELHKQNFTANKISEPRASHEKVCSNNNMHSNLIPYNESNYPISTNQSYRSFGNFNVNQPFPHREYLHPYPHTRGTLAGMSAAVNNVDQRHLPHRHLTYTTTSPTLGSEYTYKNQYSFWDTELMHQNFRQLTDIDRYQEPYSQNTTASQNFQIPVQDRSSQSIEDRSSLGLKDYLLLDHRSLKKVINKSTGGNLPPLKTPNPHNSSNFVNQSNLIEDHFSGISRNLMFEDLPIQSQYLQNIGTVDNYRRAHSQSRQQDNATSYDQYYSRLNMIPPRPPAEGYSYANSQVQEMALRDPMNLNYHRISHYQPIQGMFNPEYRSLPSIATILGRNSMQTLPSYQNFSTVDKHSKSKDPPTVNNNYNLQQNLRPETFFEMATKTMNENSYTPTNVMNKNIKETPISIDNSCSPYKDLADSNKKENYLKNNINSLDKAENNLPHTAKETPKSFKEQRFLPDWSSFTTKTNTDKLNAIHSANPSNTINRSTVIRKSSYSKDKSLDARKNAEIVKIKKYLHLYFKRMHLFSSRVLEIYHEEQRTLPEQKKILGDLMNLITSKYNNIIKDEECSSNEND